MREIKPINTSTFTILENECYATIKVDRDHWMKTHETITIDKEKTLKLLEKIKTIRYFDVVTIDLQRLKSCSDQRRRSRKKTIEGWTKYIEILI